MIYMLGNFHPSTVVDEIYGIMDDYEIATDVFNHGLCDAIADYLANHVHVEFNLCCSDWPNKEGGVCAVAFVENGYPQLVMFDYKY